MEQEKAAKADAVTRARSSLWRQSVKDIARTYLDAGLSVLPAIKERKMPKFSWKDYQHRLPTPEEFNGFFTAADEALCVICGKVSGNLEVIDFDNKGELYSKWCEMVPKELLDRVTIEQTPSGGYHVAYQCECDVSGNMKLATGDRDKPHRTLIETRGNGGLVLCAPTPGYTLKQGDYAALPILSYDEREKLLLAAWQLNENFAQSIDDDSEFVNYGMGFSKRPGDDFNERGNVRDLLVSHGWTPCGRGGENEYFRRPGKDHGGQSASLRNNVFYVFSSNAAPFESGRAYSPFAVYAILKCDGDFSVATQELLDAGYGERTTMYDDVNLDQLLKNLEKKYIDENPKAAQKTIYTLSELVEDYPEENEPLIDGLLRRGEVMNLIAAPKVGKSWITADLAVSMATGEDWMGFPVRRGRVLMIDNELHRATSAFRFRRILEAKGMTPEDVSDSVMIENQRGHLGNISDFEQRLEDLKKLRPDLIVIDAMYRALPSGIDENSNTNMATIYNLLDHYAEVLNCAFVMVHHSSKGDQSGKSVTDMGSGAGALSRACDTHMILRRHREPGCIVMDAATRSFVKPESKVFRLDFPLWRHDETLSPEDLHGATQQKGAKSSSAIIPSVPPQDIIMLALDRLDPENPPRTKEFIAMIQQDFRVSENKAKKIFYAAREAGLLEQRPGKRNPSDTWESKFVYRVGRGD